MWAVPARKLAEPIAQLSLRSLCHNLAVLPNIYRRPVHPRRLTRRAGSRPQRLADLSGKFGGCLGFLCLGHGPFSSSRGAVPELS